MKRSLIKALAGTALAGLIGVAAAAPATADPTPVWEAPLVSWDGTDGTWEQNPLEPMFSTDAMVPGDSVQAGVYIKNAGTHAAHLKVVLRDVTIPAQKRAVLDEVAALPAGVEPSDAQLAVTQLYDEVHLRTQLGSTSVDDTIPALAARTSDIVLFDADVSVGETVKVSAWYDWIYANALSGFSHAGNGVPGPWMNFKIVANMYYVEAPVTTSAAPSTTALPTQSTATTAPPSGTVVPPTSTSVEPVRTTAASTQVTAGAAGPADPAGPAAPGGWLASTGLGGPVLAVGLSGLVLLAIAIPLLARGRSKRSHA
jgi:hypothetical protein